MLLLIIINFCFDKFNLAERTEDTSKAIAAKRELRARVEEISKDYEEEKKLTFDITQDMTRQYKGMQEELLNRVIIDTFYADYMYYATLFIKRGTIVILIVCIILKYIILICIKLNFHRHNLDK